MASPDAQLGVNVKLSFTDEASAGLKETGKQVDETEKKTANFGMTMKHLARGTHIVGIGLLELGRYMKESHNQTVQHAGSILSFAGAILTAVGTVAHFVAGIMTLIKALKELQHVQTVGALLNVAGLGTPGVAGGTIAGTGARAAGMRGGGVLAGTAIGSAVAAVSALALPVIAGIGTGLASISLEEKLGLPKLPGLEGKFGLPRLPRLFATGGIVPGPIGQPVPAIVHGGEEIRPVSGGMSPITVNLQAGAFMGSETQAREFARIVARVLTEESRTRRLAVTA
jgi:hypothetical protein